MWLRIIIPAAIIVTLFLIIFVMVETKDYSHPKKNVH